MPGSIWTVVSLLTQAAESIFNGFGILWFSRGKNKIAELLHFYLFFKKVQNSNLLSREFREADFSLYSSKLYAAATLPEKSPSLICCQGQTQELLRLFPTAAASLCHGISLSSTQTHSLSPNPAMLPKNPETHNTGFFCDNLQLSSAVEKDLKWKLNPNIFK